MSRLCCADPGLFARYSNGELSSDVYLKSSEGSVCHPVSLAMLQAYSVVLAEFAEVKLASVASNNEVVLEGAPARALQLFTDAMYGHSINEAFCPSPVDPSAEDPTIDFSEATDLYWFGHKYNIGQMDPAFSEIITSHMKELNASDTATCDVIDFYNNIPEESPAVQDAIFKLLLLFKEFTNLDIMDTGYGMKIAPRHVNAFLEEVHDDPDYMLCSLKKIVSSQVCVLQTAYFSVEGGLSSATGNLCNSAGAKQGHLGSQGLHAHPS